jgi:hypothetical protein
MRWIRLISFVRRNRLDVFPFGLGLEVIGYFQIVKIIHQCFNLLEETIKICRKNLAELVILHQINFQSYHFIFYKVHLLIGINNRKILVLALFKLKILISSNLISNGDL